MGLSAYTQSLSDWSVKSLAQVQPELKCRLPSLFAADTCRELYFWLPPFSYKLTVLKLGLGSAAIENGVVLGTGWLTFRPYRRFTACDPTYATDTPTVPICR